MSGGYLTSCIFLLLIIFLLVFKNLEVWSDSLAGISQKLSPKEAEAKIELLRPASPNTERIGPNQEEAKVERAGVTDGFHRKVNSESDGIKIQEPAPLSSYQVIAEKNIFSPERKDFLTPVKTEAAQKTPVRPRVTLYGIAIFGDYEAATLSYSERPLRKGEREAMTLKVGEKIGEYKLAKIADDRITLEAAGDSFEVLLYDRKKSKTRVEAKTGIQPAPEVKPAQMTPVTPRTVGMPKDESMQKPVEPAKERVITHLSPFPSKDFLISRSRRSEAIRQSLRASGRQSGGLVESSTPNTKER